MLQKYALQGPVKFLGAAIIFFIIFFVFGYQILRLHEYTLEGMTLVLGSLGLACTFLWMYFDSKKQNVEIGRYSVPDKYKYILAGWVFLFVGMIAASTAESMSQPAFYWIRLGMGGLFCLIGLICFIVSLKQHRKSKSATPIDKSPI